MVKKVVNLSKIRKMYGFFVGLTIYIFVVGCIDMLFIESADLLTTRIRCINQLLILSFFQFCSIVYILVQCEKRNYEFENIVRLLITVAFIQGCCAIAAFMSPSIRELFIMFGDRDLYDNEFFLERRGFGFSMTLIDTFGYGMGLIAGYLLLYQWKEKDRKRIIILLLILFTIAVNARTGIVVFGIALLLKFVQNKTKLQIVLMAIPCILIFSYSQTIIPFILKAGINSENPTLVWICSDMLEMYYMLFAQGTSDAMAMDEVTFLSNFIGLPTNGFELVFGSGHYVYDTYQTLGFRTDIGYYNMFWEFGIIVSIIILVFFTRWLLGPYWHSKDKSMINIAVFNFICYAFLLLKAILLGYNPGVFINYLITFSMYYYMKKRCFS